MEFGEILKLVLGIITGKGGAAIVGAGVTLALIYAMKMLPKFLGDKLSEELTKGFDEIGHITDPTRKQLVENVALDLVRLAEYEVPDAGQGRARYEKVSAWLCVTFPILKGRDKTIADLIEAAVVKMDEALKAQSNKK